jgi:uncharacterized coiled-coil protein SlyX
MAMQNNKNYTIKEKSNHVWLVALVAILVGSFLSWLMVYNLAASKSAFTSEINKINNSLEHIGDANSSMVSFSGYQDNLFNSLSDSTQSQFGNVNNAISDANKQIIQNKTNLTAVTTRVSSLQTQISTLQTQTGTLQTQNNTLQTQSSNQATQLTQLNTQLTTLNQTAGSTQTALTSLTAKVNALPAGLQIAPSVSSNTITLTINSSVAQAVDFDIEFRPTTDFPTTKATMDGALAALYTTPPVTLTAGSSVRGDYTLYWNTSDSTYHLGAITFVTMRTSLSAGTNTKTLTFVTTGSYEILITPEYPTGTSTGSW